VAFGSACVRVAAAGEVAAAVSAAAGADLVVAVVGMTAEDEGEFHDRASVRLGSSDVALLSAIAGANPRTVVVLISGGPVLVGDWHERAPAVLLAWYPGMEGGRALADVITGAVEPGGRLPAVIAAQERDLPPFDNTAGEVTYDRWCGQRRLDRDGVPALYPFGFGLGYTSLSVTGIAVEAWSAGEESVVARVGLVNRGARDGSTVVQLYGTAADGARELLGFRRVSLAAGASGDAVVNGSLRPLSVRDPARRIWSLRPGPYLLEASQFWGDPTAVALEQR
jgi:beta-glucosidase